MKSNIVYNLQESHEPIVKHRVIYKIIDKKIKSYTAVSKHIVKVLERLPVTASKIKLIYNGIPPVKILSPDKLKSIYTDPVLTFGIIGQVGGWKGHGTLIKASEILIKEGIQNFRILIYGNDNNPYGDKCKSELKQKGIDQWFNWKGFVINQDEIYNECGVVVVPSLSYEPCSLTIIESMRREKGIIASDRGGNPELIQHLENGLIFSAENSEELAKCMQQLVMDRKKIGELALKARQKAEIHYLYQNMTDQYVDIYSKI